MIEESIHLAIVGKNEIIREGLKRILVEQDFFVDGTVSRPVDLDQCVSDGMVIIVDASDIDEGIATCEEIRVRYPQARIVIMADEYSVQDVSRAFTTGAVDGYVVKQISCLPLAGALRLTALGEKVLPSQIADSLATSQPCSIAKYWNVGAAGSNLSTREVDILRCLVDGEPNKVISRRLQIADATVKVHIKAILRKLRVRNRTQAAIWAVSRGLVSDASGSATPAPAAEPAGKVIDMQAARPN